MRLVRREQMKVLPDFGFEASEHGVEAMLRAFAEWKGDCDVQVQEKIIQDTLRSAEPKNEADHVEAPARTRPANKFDIANMLHELQIAFSEPWFQDEIHELRVSADYRAGRRNPEPGALPTLDEHAVDPEGYYNLSGRAALALQGHKHILPRYCFEGTPEGVRKMLLHVSTYLGDKDVDRAFDAVNCKLGMEPNARLRFRQLVASASAQSLDLEARSQHCWTKSIRNLKFLCIPSVKTQPRVKLVSPKMVVFLSCEAAKKKSLAPRNAQDHTTARPCTARPAGPPTRPRPDANPEEGRGNLPDFQGLGLFLLSLGAQA